MKVLLEVCCADIESVIAARDGGADRIELCSGLECGGLTPSIGLIRGAVRLMPGRVNVLIRPRGGDFLYSEEELEVVKSDIVAAREQGVSGIVFGALTAEGRLDIEVLESIISIARPCSFTLHRAFDVSRDPFEALDDAINLGVDRILTSGCAPDVEKGINRLRELNRHASGRTIILAGGGVTPENARYIAEETGVRELHGSCKANVCSRMTFRRTGISMGNPDSDEYARMVSSEQIIHNLKQMLS